MSTNVQNYRANMSHTVTVTRTTTSTTTSAIILNTGYLKTLPGLLKLAQVIIGAVILFIYIYNLDNTRYVRFTSNKKISFYCYYSCVFQEFIYHGGAFIFYIIASTILLLEVSNDKYNSHYEKPFYVISVSIAKQYCFFL
ncbi:CKLF-like MARVEL transmembrane domain-containing protein 8 [Diaphorina citri]|uniref:CKLF-like MARVEL transmembrane domain-containing protein 8 n=1 Tax=Diaphorina citri TaxID=121845 RepID=A0A1S3D3X8_DIACI|nr:CKLF-like MARVEL transmembrane domain-containing protein 8 [Diaphorina citri]